MGTGLNKDAFIEIGKRIRDELTEKQKSENGRDFVQITKTVCAIVTIKSKPIIGKYGSQEGKEIVKVQKIGILRADLTNEGAFGLSLCNDESENWFSTRMVSEWIENTSKIFGEIPELVKKGFTEGFLAGKEALVARNDWQDNIRPEIKELVQKFDFAEEKK